jgi:dynein heavy chain
MDRLGAAVVTEQVEGLLERSSAPPAGEEPGPDSELEHWRQQMSRLNSLTEQLKSHECRLVLGVTSMAHSQVREAARSA